MKEVTSSNFEKKKNILTGDQDALTCVFSGRFITVLANVPENDYSKP